MFSHDYPHDIFVISVHWEQVPGRPRCFHYSRVDMFKGDFFVFEDVAEKVIEKDLLGLAI